MGNFKEDLEKGKEMEAKIMAILNANSFNLIKNPNEKGMDLLIIEHGIEVKLDEYAKYSGNFYIEFECNGKPSGIFKNDDVKLKWWVHSDGDKILMLDGPTLKEWVEGKINLCRANKTLTHKCFKVIEAGGNGGKTKGLLVPVKELEAIADRIFNTE